MWFREKQRYKNMEYEQERLAVLDESEICLFYCIRPTDGMAVIEREKKGKSDEMKFVFDFVDPLRVRRISHKFFKKRKDFDDISAFIKEKGL